MLKGRRLGAVDRLDGGFEVHPDVGQAQPKGGAATHGVGSEDAAQFGEQWVEPVVDGGGVGFSPQGLGQFVAWDLAVAVDDEIGEQQSALAAGESGFEALAVALDGERTADLDAHRVPGRQGHANILAICWAQYE
jgi:hypothetical protein